MHTATAFGSSWSTPATAAGVLRAQAAGAVALEPLHTTDAAAAVIGAHLWATVTGEQTLGAASRHSAPAVHAAASILARAAGQRSHQDPDQTAAEVADALEHHTWSDSPHRAAIEEALATAMTWSSAHLADDLLPQALRAAAWDLSIHLLATPVPAGPSRESYGLCYAAAVLAAHAEELADTAAEQR